MHFYNTMGWYVTNGDYVELWLMQAIQGESKISRFQDFKIDR